MVVGDSEKGTGARIGTQDAMGGRRCLRVEPDAVRQSWRTHVDVLFINPWRITLTFCRNRIAGTPFSLLRVERWRLSRIESFYPSRSRGG